MIIDSHAHLDFEDFKNDLPEVLDRARQAGVRAILTIGIDLKTTRAAIEIAEKHPDVFATAGIHPHEADIADENASAQLETLARSSKKIVAVGECGLDYVRSKTSRAEQEKAFIMQMTLAEKLHLPVVIHSRGSYPDVLKVLESFSGRVKGVIHCMSGDETFRDRALALGYYIAIGGPVTYPSGGGLRAVMSGVPLNRLLVETDCPFLRPTDKRLGRNEPALLREVLDALSALYGVKADEIGKITSQNAIRAFNLPITL
jgi:TatD DNase family protein